MIFSNKKDGRKPSFYLNNYVLIIITTSTTLAHANRFAMGLALPKYLLTNIDFVDVASTRSQIGS